MQLLSREGIDQLIEANPFAGFAAERGIALSPLGRELLLGRCPFEQEAVGRALLVEPVSGRFRCLACWVHGGNVIDFVMKLDGMTFMAALEHLARRAGLDLAMLMRSRPASPVRSGAEVRIRRASIRRGSSAPLRALTPSLMDTVLALMPDEPLEYRLSELKLSPWGMRPSGLVLVDRKAR